MPRTIITALAAIVLGGTLASDARAITSVRVTTGLASPTFVTAPDGDTNRVFVLEQPGRIRLVKNGTLLTRPFLDILSVVNGGGEQGLLGLAFDPDFATNRYFYVYYIGGAGSGESVIERYEATAADPDSADAGTAHKVLVRNQPAGNHNGGTIEFGTDDYLYFAFGDGGGSNDPQNRAQNLLDFMGKMIRIDVDGDDFPADVNNNYAIPATNPFVGSPSALDEIWSYGLRNPYRWSFDRLTNDIYIGDVGQNCWEEISFQPASSTGGENYGWRITEGTRCFEPSDAFNCNQPATCSAGLVPPIYEYNHNTNGFSCSVTGGSVYRGSAISGIDGHYFFADYCSRQIYSFRKNGPVIQGFVNRTVELTPDVGTINSISSIGTDGVGELYITDLDGGELFKIIPEGSTGVDATVNPPSTITLAAGAPNPFTEVTNFDLQLGQSLDVNVSVYTASGRLVRTLHDGIAPAGGFPLQWRGRDQSDRPLPSGVYFLRAKAADRTVTQRVTLIR